MGVQTKKNHRKKRSRTQKQKRGGGYLWDSPKEKLIKKTKKELKQLIAEKEDINLVDLHSKDKQIRKSTRNKIKGLNIEIEKVINLLEEYKKLPDNVKQKELDGLVSIINKKINEKINKYITDKYIDNRSLNDILNSPTNTTPKPNIRDTSRLSQKNNSSFATPIDDISFKPLTIDYYDDVVDDDDDDDDDDDLILYLTNQKFKKLQKQRQERTQFKQPKSGKISDFPKDVNDTKNLRKYKPSMRRRFINMFKKNNE
jgi:hypothetical protein